MRDRQQPLEQGKPAVAGSFDIRIIDLQVDGLLIDGGQVLVCEQGRVGADPGLEAGKLARKVEPPAWITLSKRMIKAVAEARPIGSPPAGSGIS